MEYDYQAIPPAIIQAVVQGEREDGICLQIAGAEGCPNRGASGEKVPQCLTCEVLQGDVERLAHSKGFHIGLDVTAGGGNHRGISLIPNPGCDKQNMMFCAWPTYEGQPGRLNVYPFQPVRD